MQRQRQKRLWVDAGLAGRCGWAGHAVNPSMGARRRHPWRLRSCPPAPPHPRQFPGDGWFSTICVDEVYWETRRGQSRFPAENGSDPNPMRAAVASAFALLLSFPAVMATETVRGRAGGLAAGVSRMDAATEPAGTYSRRPPDNPSARPSQASLKPPPPQRGLSPLAGNLSTPPPAHPCDSPRRRNTRPCPDHA